MNRHDLQAERDRKIKDATRRAISLLRSREETSMMKAIGRAVQEEDADEVRKEVEQCVYFAQTVGLNSAAVPSALQESP